MSANIQQYTEMTGESGHAFALSITLTTDFTHTIVRDQLTIEMTDSMFCSLNARNINSKHQELKTQSNTQQCVSLQIL